MELEGDHQAAAADVADLVGPQLAKLCEEVGPLFGRVVDHPLLDQHPHGGPRDGAGQGVPAERAAVLARLQHAEDFVV